MTKYHSGAGKLRIIGGRWRNTKLAVPNVKILRPTPERLRETLFNWLRPSIAGRHCLDLFAGTGILAFEALSRGAGSATLVESQPHLAALIRVHQLRLKADARVYRADARRWLSTAKQHFDLVFIDPPFASDLLTRTGHLLAQRQLLNDGALIYCEQPHSDSPPDLPSHWQLLRQTRVGVVNGLLYLHTSRAADSG